MRLSLGLHAMNEDEKPASQEVLLKGEEFLKRALLIAVLSIAVLAGVLTSWDFRPDREELTTVAECTRHCSAKGMFSNPVPDGPMPAKPIGTKYRCFCY